MPSGLLANISRTFSLFRTRINNTIAMSVVTRLGSGAAEKEICVDAGGAERVGMGGVRGRSERAAERRAKSVVGRAVGGRIGGPRIGYSCTPESVAMVYA